MDGGSDSYPGSGVSRSRLITGLLFLILLLVLGLVWQAAQTMRSNRDTATRVLQDYARLVVDEFARRAMGEIGYYGYYAHITAISQRYLAGDDILAAAHQDGAGQPASPLAHYRFLVDPSVEDVRFSPSIGQSTGVERYLARHAAKILRQPAAEAGFTVDHPVIDGRAHSFVFARGGEAGRVFGFAVDRTGLSGRLRELFGKEALLPQSLAGGEITNEFVFLRFADNNSQVLFQSRDKFDPDLLVRRTLGDEYQGVFAGHTIAAAIDASVADALVIGGLPRSRVPVLVVTMLLTVALLVAAIRQLYREQLLMKMRSDFVSEVSHELRTPLTQIRMFTETLLFDRFRAGDDRRRALEIINRESQRLIHLVENVLRFSDRNGSRRRLSFTRARLAPLIERVIEEFRPLAEGRGNSIVPDLHPQAEAAVDADALRQILLNLLDNAVKYGPPGQQLRVVLQERAGGVRIRVCDQGPGVPRADREKIWSGYYRLDRERCSAIAGTGIGLAVVRELVTRHGGSTLVDENENGGACFVVDLPDEPESR